MRKSFIFTMLFLAFAAVPVIAQEDQEKKDEKTVTIGPDKMQFYTPRDARGNNLFEPAKFATQPKFKGFNFDLGLATSADIQNLRHSNTAVGASPLIPIGLGMTLPNANMVIGAQLVDGIRVQTELFLSSHHHNETWVKDGYIQIDKLPIDHPMIGLFNATGRIKGGMMELNYGDLHFSRADGGRTNRTAFIDNAIIDSFAIEPAVENYFFLPKVMFMIGLTSGQNKGDVTGREKAKTSFFYKTAYDNQITKDLRFRTSFSLYTNRGNGTATIFAADRTNSKFDLVMEPVGATTSANFTSGRFNPNLKTDVTTWMLNPYLEFKNFEFLGAVERMSGLSGTETVNRTWNQYLGQIVYSFLLPKSEDVKPFVGLRYNTVSGNLNALNPDVSIDRYQASLGLDLTNYIRAKLVYTNQEYKGFALSDIRNGGRFHGLTLESSVTF
jgi:hypothetical protein